MAAEIVEHLEDGRLLARRPFPRDGDYLVRDQLGLVHRHTKGIELTGEHEIEGELAEVDE